MFKMIFRRTIARRYYDDVVAPLQRIANELLTLQEQNEADIELNQAVISKLQDDCAARHEENLRASEARSKILAILKI